MLIERKDFKEKDGNIGYIESVFESGNVLKTTYFPQQQRLYIAFNRGHTYSYGNIDVELYNEFENNYSQGIFFYNRIKDKKEYPSRKEFTLYPTEIKELKEIIETHKNSIENEDE